MSDPHERLARAAERIADALEFLVRTAQPAGPQPDLKVARAPSDTSRMESVTLRPGEGLMMAIVQNVGDADTVVSRPTARLGTVELVGGLIDRDSRPQPTLTVPGAPSGPGVVIQFQFERGAHILGDLPLTIRLPHQPGRLPVPSVLEVRLEPSGLANGRYQWRVVESREVSEVDGSA